MPLATFGMTFGHLTQKARGGRRQKWVAQRREGGLPRIRMARERSCGAVLTGRMSVWEMGGCCSKLFVVQCLAVRCSTSQLYKFISSRLVVQHALISTRSGLRRSVASVCISSMMSTVSIPYAGPSLPLPASESRFYVLHPSATPTPSPISRSLQGSSVPINSISQPPTNQRKIIQRLPHLFGRPAPQYRLFQTQLALARSANIGESILSENPIEPFGHLRAWHTGD